MFNCVDGQSLSLSASKYVFGNGDKSFAPSSMPSSSLPMPLPDQETNSVKISRILNNVINDIQNLERRMTMMEVYVKKRQKRRTKLLRQEQREITLEVVRTYLKTEMPVFIDKYVHDKEEFLSRVTMSKESGEKLEKLAVGVDVDVFASIDIVPPLSPISPMSSSMSPTSECGEIFM